MTPLTQISPVRPPDPVAPVKPASPAQAGFSSVLSGALNGVDTLQKSAEAEIGRFLRGEGVDLHQVALAQQQAQLGFDLFLQVRNKVVQAYQEIMRMQV
jgi:flagellar hook-basal body complex protein FliE